ncbi:MAG TPA: hypothetical protein VIN06_10080 [Devosia sp.]
MFSVKELETQPEELSLTAVTQLRTHPAFRKTMRQSMQSSIALHRGGRLLGWILGDRARAAFGHALMYLHATYDPADPRSGLTPGRTRELCTELGLCSANRAAAMLALMQVAGYVAPVESTGDARVRRLVPTEKLRVLQRARISGQIEALSIAVPEVRPALGRLGDPAFERIMAVGFAGFFLNGVRVLQHAEPIRLFAERSTGVVLLFDLLLQGWDRPEHEIELSIADLARRYGVSRVHINRLLRDAEAAGSVERTGNSLYLTRSCRDAAERFVATAMLLFKAVVTRALAAEAA